MEWFVPSDFCACPTKARGDEEHGEEERREYTSYTSEYKIIVVGFEWQEEETIICRTLI